MENHIKDGFRKHLLEARKINKDRKGLYSLKTKGKSRFVSNVLIWAEKMLYPVAWYFDIRAKQFNDQGIGIITNDFVSLQDLPAVDSKPTFNNKLSYKLIRHLFVLMYKLRKEVRRHLRNYNFKGAHSEICKNLIVVSSIESENNVHIAMLKHILESAAFASKNAIGYSKQGNINVPKLSALFIRTQMLGTILSPLIDRAASKIHQLGVGVVENDMPKIHYE